MKQDYNCAASGSQKTLNSPFTFFVFFSFLIIFYSGTGSLYAQGKNGNKDVIVRTCVQFVGNGLYQASFSYENPSKKEVEIDPSKSKVKLKNQKREFQGPHKFKPGLQKKVFSLTFNEKESVSWTITTPSGNVKEVIADANSSKCLDDEGGFIFPVIGINEKVTGVLAPFAFAYATDNAGDNPLDFIYQLRGEDLLVEIVPNSGQMEVLLQELQTTLGLSFAAGDFIVDPQVILTEGYGAVDCYLNKEELLYINDLTEVVNFARVLQRPVNLDFNDPTGVAVSEGVAAHRADLVRRYFGLVQDGEARFVDGSGMGICAFSDTFDMEEFTGDKSKAQVAVENGDLPGPENPYNRLLPVVNLGEDQSGTDEGRAMLEIVHDVAPGAELFFRTATRSPRDFAQGIKDLPPSVNIGFDDVTYVTESFEPQYSDISAAISEFLAPGDRYFLSASGNFSGKGFQGTYQPGSDLPDFGIPVNEGVRPHVFGLNEDGSENYYLSFTVEPGIYMVVLQQDEAFASFDNSSGADSDFDLVITNAQGGFEAASRYQNDNRDPLEVFVFQALESGEAFMSVLVENGISFAGTPFRAIAFRANGLEFSTPQIPTISGHAALDATVTVGAINQALADNPIAETFSSFGGQTSSGTAILPDLAGYDGVATNVTGFSPFFGTSAAVPHIAGLIALLDPFLGVVNADAQAGGGTQTEEPLFILEDMDVVSLYQQFSRGSGQTLQIGPGAPDALNTFDFLARRAPIAEYIDPETIPEQPGTASFTSVIVGENFGPDAKVFVGGVEAEIVEVTETTITFIVPEFTGNPDVVVEVEPKSLSGNELVTSNPLNFLPDGRLAINIIAEPEEINYGQSFDFNFRVEGLPADVTYEDTGLPAVSYVSPANDLLPYPDANTYLVTPGFEVELTEEQQQMYQVNFVASTLKVNLQDLLIKPYAATITYGDIVDLDIEYIFDPTGIDDPDLFLNTISSAHESGYYPGNNYVLINRLRRVLNSEEIIAFLDNNAWMASGNIFQNRLRRVLNGFNVIDLETDHFDDYFNSYDPVTNRLRTIMNRLRTIMNAQDFFEGRVDVTFENRLRRVLNETSIGGEDDETDYSAVFAIIDEEDLSTDTEEKGVSELFAVNLITGLGVTTTDDTRQYTYSGPLLHPIRSNFNTSYDDSRLTILPATLTVTTGDLLLAQGEEIDSTQIAYTIAGFEYGETEADVYPEGVKFSITNASGLPYTPGDVGTFLIDLAQPENYIIENDNPGILYVNPVDGSKLRAYFDCVQLNPDAVTDGYEFIANFRYINPNDFSLYLFDENNYIEGDGAFSNDLPVEFLPGEHHVRIRFDGQRMTWNLTSFGSTSKSSVTTDATLETNRCTAKQIEDIMGAYLIDKNTLSASSSKEINFSLGMINEITVYPNPVSEQITVHPGSGAVRKLTLYDVTGKVIFEQATDNSGIRVANKINTSELGAGIYLLKVVTTLEEKVIKVVKQ